jgi:hypothetical protein
VKERTKLVSTEMCQVDIPLGTVFTVRPKGAPAKSVWGGLSSSAPANQGLAGGIEERETR